MCETEALNLKKRCRNGHRTSTKRVISAVNEIMASVTEKAQLTPHVAKLKQSKATLEQKMEVLSAQNAETVNLVSEEDIELEIEQADILQEKIQSTIIEIEMAFEEYKQPGPIIKQLENTQNTTTPTLPASAQPESSGATSNAPAGIPQRPTSTASNVPAIKLPKLNIQNFCGNPTRWSTFWDTFESPIHNNPTLSTIEKFRYLLSYLEGPAAAAIAGLT